MLPHALALGDDETTDASGRGLGVCVRGFACVRDGASCGGGASALPLLTRVLDGGDDGASVPQRPKLVLDVDGGGGAAPPLLLLVRVVSVIGVGAWPWTFSCVVSFEVSRVLCAHDDVDDAGGDAGTRQRSRANGDASRAYVCGSLAAFA